MYEYFGCNASWRLSIAVLVLILLQYSFARSKESSFTGQLQTMLRSPSQHGKKATRTLPAFDKLSKRHPRSAKIPETPTPEYAEGYNEENNTSNEGNMYYDDIDFTKLYEILYKGPVCDIIDARGQPDSLKDLENCTIVNGFVNLVFMHDISEEDLKKYRFPKLRVITHYLLVFRMYNLRTLHDMFPNLAVIGGQELFREYALVIYENPHMTEIGLSSLQFIVHGSVRVQKNSNLCYLNTIDWERLGEYQNNVKLKDVVITENREYHYCIDQCGEGSNCPKDSSDKETCWGINKCQKKRCPAECPYACMNDLCQCHEQCLAGCTKANDPSACIACREKYHNGTCLRQCPEHTHAIHGWKCITAEECKRLDWAFHEGTCRLQCPSGYQVQKKNDTKICVKCEANCGEVCKGPILINDLRSLLLVKGCREIDGSLTISINGGCEQKYFYFNHSNSDSDHSKGCAEVVKELDRAFTDLEVIGSLIVRRSYPLVTLSFLRNVRRITGIEMEQDTYSVYVLESRNLKELWNFKKSNLTIEKGKAFFHFNPHLCLKTIDTVRELTKPIEDDKDISVATNGDRAACDITPLKILHIRKMTGKGEVPYAFVIISWENADVKDPRTLIGYQVFYKESPKKDAKRYEGVDACGRNSWTILDKHKTNQPRAPSIPINGTNVTNPASILTGPENPGNTSVVIPHLKPFTQYAYYVRAYTTSTARRGAESKIGYFTTPPNEPSQPRALKADPKSFSELIVSWEPPASPNGIITHYIVRWRRQPEEDLRDVHGMDACEFVQKRPLERPKKPTTITSKGTSSSTNGQILRDGCCSCKGESFKDIEDETMDSAEFENYLQNRIFIPYPEPSDFSNLIFDETPSNRSRRSTSYFDRVPTPRRYRKDLRPQQSYNTSSANGLLTTNYNHTGTTVTSSITSTLTAPTKLDKQYLFQRMVVNFTNATIINLHHYSEYDIQVYACNHASDPRSKYDLSFPLHQPGKDYSDCSIEAIVNKRTLPDSKADVIPSGTVSSSKEESKIGTATQVTKVTWKTPMDPNGYIKLFQIELNNTESAIGNKTVCVPVNASVRDEMSFTINALKERLAPGPHTARVRAVSLFAPGEWSEPVQFQVSRSNESQAPTTTIIVVIGSLVIVVLIAMLIVFYIYKTRARPIDPHDYIDPNPEYKQFVYIPDEYEIDPDNVTQLEEIGHGNFGKVFFGLAKEVVKGQLETKVAIKKLHENALPGRRFDFLKEASMMKAFNAHHVVRLLGVVSRTVDPLVIMEFMEKGDLKSFLRSRREGAEENVNGLQAPTTQEKIQMAAEIADGMAYLADNKFVHRDLAARNCLVDANCTVKIGDFGLTRDIYETDYYRKESRGFLPIRWMAPESLKDGIFDSRSDVWSYGVVLWELSTLAEQPYQGQQHDEVTRFVIDGGYMERPKDCPKRLYDLMTTCWQYNPKMRPVFLEIVQALYDDVNEEFKEVSFYSKCAESSGGGVDEGAEVQIMSPLQHYGKNGGILPANATHSQETPLVVQMDARYTSSPTHFIPSETQTQWRSGEPLIHFKKKNPVPVSSTPPGSASGEEKQNLLVAEEDSTIHFHHPRPKQNEVSFRHSGSGDSLSLNTTSTTAPDMNSPLRQRYNSGSSYENDFDQETPFLSHQKKDLDLCDSGTTSNKSHRSDVPDRLSSYSHLNGGHKRKKHTDLELDIESGLDDNTCGYSDLTSTPPSVGTPVTPNEANLLLLKGESETKTSYPYICQTEPSSSSC